MKSWIKRVALVAAALLLVAATAVVYLSPRVFWTLADMDATRPSRNAPISIVVCRTSLADWGGPKLFWYDYTNSLATNAIRRAVAGGLPGRNVHTWGGDVRVFGVEGDGIVDDTAALTGAIDQCKIQKIKLYLPTGIYKVTAALDCRNSDDNALEFPGIRGDGLTLTQIIAYHNDPIIQLRGRGGEYSDLRIGYSEVNSNSTANAITGYGFVYYLSIRNVEVVNAYRGIFSDTGTSSSFFSCSIDNLTVRSCYFANGDVQTSSGSTFNNIYLSNPGSSAVDFLWRDRAGGSWYAFITLEHSNIRDCAIRILGSGASIGKLRFEGIRTVTDANLIDAGGNGLTVNSVEMANNFFSGHLLSGITSNGVATIETLGHAVSAGHGFRIGDTVTIGGALVAGYNGSFTISAVTSSNFTYTPTGSPGANATTNFAAGHDCIWAYVGSFPAPALTATETYGSGKVRIGHLESRNNKILGSTPTIRQGWAMLLAREFGGKRLDASIDTISQGSQFRVGDQVLDFNPIIASSVSSGIATVYLKYPHELEQGKRVSVSGGINLNYGTNYAQIASVPDRYSFTMATPASDSALTNEFGNMIPVKAKISFRSRTNDKALLTTDVAHQMTVGARVMIRSNSVANYNKAEALVDSVPTTTSFTYVSIGTDEANTAESTGIIYEFNSGLNAQLQSSATVGLRKAGDFFEPQIAVPYHELAANTSTTMLYTVSGVRPNASVRVAPFSALTLTPGTRYYAGVATNDQVLVFSENLTGSPKTNEVRLIKLFINQ